MTTPRRCKQKQAKLCPPVAPAPVADGVAPARALYVHVPFCAARCRYCDFHSVVGGAALQRRWLGALLAELRGVADGLGRPAGSVFLGGGTPTSLAPDVLAGLLDAVAPRVGPETEFTVEANPGTLTADRLDALTGAGVNRVSLGVQSFDDDELRLLGRIHSAGEAVAAFRALRDAGFDNVGIDLIYGLGGSPPDTWKRSVTRALELGVDHLSCYALSFEPGTPLAADRATGRVAAADDDLQRRCYEHVVDAAGAAGLEHYEISNFARPGRRCRHNLVYWRNEPYVGVGPAAASYVDGLRRTNAADLPAYVEALERGDLPPATSERLAGRAAMGEALMLALRLIDGVDRAAFARRYGADPAEAFARTVTRYAGQGKLIVTDERIRLAPDALFVSDTILADLLSEA